MIDIILNNPYRILGVYINSPKKDQVANKGRISAFLRVNRHAELPLDYNNILPTLNRTAEAVNEADAKLTLANEQVKYAQFWFVKASPLDDIAFNHLSSGNIDAALAIWQKASNISSLQNSFVCSLIQGNGVDAVNLYAIPLYKKYGTDFIRLVAGDNTNISQDELIKNVVDVLAETTDVSLIKLYISIEDEDWKQLLKGKLVSPLITTLENAVLTAKESRNKGITARYNAGTKLMNDAKSPLEQLRKILSSSNLQYQTIADNVGLEILQCGIDYFNKSEAADAPFKAMVLQKYAQSIVVGSMAKDRCDENVKILQRIIDELPPREIISEVKAINEEQKAFCQLPDRIIHSLTLLRNTKPLLQAIKTKLGSSDSYYLKLSTHVIDNALHNVIEEVNLCQKTLPTQGSLNSIFLKASISSLKTALDSAWEAVELMDSFDMDSSFRANRYSPNRSALRKLKSDVGELYNKVNGISSSYSSPRSYGSSYSSSSSSNYSSSSSNSYSSSHSTSNSNSGCMVWLVMAISLAIIAGCACL